MRIGFSDPLMSAYLSTIPLATTMGKKRARSEDAYEVERQFDSEGNEIFAVELIDAAKVFEDENGQACWVCRFAFRVYVCHFVLILVLTRNTMFVGLGTAENTIRWSSRLKDAACSTHYVSVT
jgi:hypothetical protein